MLVAHDRSRATSRRVPLASRPPRHHGRARAARRGARLRQRVGDPRSRAGRLPRAGGVRPRDGAHRARDRRRPDLPAPSRHHGAGGVDAHGGVGRTLPARHRAEPPALDGRRARPRHGRAPRRDARVPRGPAGGAARAGDLPGAVLPGPLDRRLPGAGAAGAAGRPRAADAGAGRGARRRGRALAVRPGVHSRRRRARARARPGACGEAPRGLRDRRAGPACRHRGPRGRHAALPGGAGPLSLPPVLPDDVPGQRLRGRAARVRPGTAPPAATRTPCRRRWSTRSARSATRAERGRRSRPTGPRAPRCRSSARSARPRRPTPAGRSRPWRRDVRAEEESMPLLGRGVLAIWHTISPEGETDYWRWHDREHIPERVGVPGFLRGRRYRSLERSLDYLDFYEVESPETLAERALSRAPERSDAVDAPHGAALPGHAAGRLPGGQERRARAGRRAADAQASPAPSRRPARRRRSRRPVSRRSRT